MSTYGTCSLPDHQSWHVDIHLLHWVLYLWLKTLDSNSRARLGTASAYIFNLR
jgi:hypothetical protein